MVFVSTSGLPTILSEHAKQASRPRRPGRIFLVRPSQIVGHRVMLALTRLVAFNVFPPLELGGAANAWIEAVAGIKALIVMDQLRLGIIQMAEAVFGWELRTASVQKSPHLALEFKGLVTLPDNVVLVEDVTEKMPVIELVENRPIYLLRQGLEPVLLVASESYVECNHILDIAGMDGLVPDTCASCCKTVQKGSFAFVLRALEEVAL